MKRSEWTLFLDRDGVINERLPEKYVQSWSHFKFIGGVLSAIPILNKYFNRIIIVSNQQGIGKKLMTLEDLKSIHSQMLEEINLKGGIIDEVIFCPDLHQLNPNCRKPAPFMALEAQKKFPDINFKKSVMIGDQVSDILFGKNLEMRCIWVPENIDTKWNQSAIEPDEIHNDLLSYAEKIDTEFHGK